MNKVMMIGRVCKDIELKKAGQSVVAKFVIAVDRKFKREGGETADFLNVTVWGKTAEFVIKYFAKGVRIGLAGRIETRSWEHEGQKRYATDIIAEEVYFADGKKDNAQNISSNDETGFFSTSDEELPF